MNISNIIKDILYTREQVVIPELGAFIRTAKPAKLSESKKVIQPPETDIEFDNTKTTNDGVLSNFLVQNGEINPEQAKELIDNYVAEVKEKLENQEAIEFLQLGSLRFDADKKIAFSKDKKSTFIPDNFALSELDVEPIKKEEVPEKENEEKKKPIGIWIAIAAAVIVILIVVFPLRNYLNKQKTAENTETIDNESLIEAENIVPDTTETTPAETIEENTEAETDVISNQIKFHIIAGSFGSVENAQNLKNELKKQNYNAKVLPKDGDWYRVSMAGFTDRAGAENKMKELNNAGIKYEIWLFVNK